jgi:hypothetical protein
VIRLLDAYGGCGVFRSAAFGPLLGSWHDGDGMMAGWGSSIRKFQESLCFARVFLEEHIAAYPYGAKIIGFM